MELSEKGIPKRSRPNYTYATIGVALVLFLIGVFGLILLNGQSLINSYKEKMNVMVELKSDLPNHEYLRIRQTIEHAKYTKKGSVVFVSKDEAAKQLAKDLGEEFSSLGFSNPLYDVINFSTIAEYAHPDSLSALSGALKQSPIVVDVYYQAVLADNIEKNVRSIGWIALIIGALFILIAITLIHNTIKLALYSNRFLIKNMELAGASWGFISRPYLWKSLKNGLLSALIAISLLILVIVFIRNNMVEIESLIDPFILGILFGSMTLLGILITGLSTYYIVNKYLRMRLDDLY